MPYKKWNWQLKEWPDFKYDKEALKELEYLFLQNSGMVVGALKHLEGVTQDDLLIEILSNEAIKTSEIEGDILNRESVQASIRRRLGLEVDTRRVSPAEQGISEMIVDLYLNFKKPLTHEQLYSWHEMLTSGRRDLLDIGKYRTHEDPMQIVSGRLDTPNVHYEAPPSKQIYKEMERFVNWFNKTHDDTSAQDTLPLVRAGISHLYFVSIHPFEDGNGRIGRAIAEKSIALSLGKPSLISLSNTIEAKKKDYYAFLERKNTTLEITDWLIYFGQTILDAQEDTLKRIDFLVDKAKFYDRYSGQMNDRQEKVVNRLFEAGHTGFEGGLSADNYKTIAKTSASTATRDLQDMLDKEILIKTGTLKSTRYYLNL